MKNVKRVLVLVLLLSFVLAGSVQVLAAADYTYTVRVYTGKSGKFPNGSDTMVFTDVPAGSTMNLSYALGSVQPMDGSSYYVKGLRLSGRDGSEKLASLNVTVVEDMDFVVVYGIMGEMVSYTVNYVDTNGVPLRASKTAQGCVGDKPVEASVYIEGYVPNAYNITGTLKADPALNQFTFVYTKQVMPQGETVVVYVDNGNQGNATTNTGNNTGNNNNTGDNTAGANQETVAVPEVSTPEQAAAAQEQQVIATQGQDISGEGTVPLDIIDLDEEQTATPTTFFQEHKPTFVIGGLALGLALIALLLFFLLRNRDDDEDEEDEDEPFDDDTDDDSAGV